MIGIARILALALAAVSLVAVVATLALAQMAGALLDPGTYATHLDKTDIYEFVLGDLPASLLEDRRAVEQAMTGAEIEETPLLASGLTTERIVESIERAVPPEWLRETVERNLEELGGYLAGRRDNFILEVRTYERTDALLAEARALLDEADAYALVHERAALSRIEEAAVEWVREDLPFDVGVTDERVQAAVRAVLPPEWARLHGPRVFDQAASYVKGETGALALAVPLSDRADAAAEEVKDILGETPAQDLLYEQVVGPVIDERLGETVEVPPFGGTVTAAQVLTALRQAAPPEWVQSQAERLVDEASPYVAGRADGFEFRVSVAENKRTAAASLTTLVERQVREQVNRLPVCRTPEEGMTAVGGAPRLPPCLAPSADLDRFAETLRFDIADGVALSLLAPIPDVVVFTEADLRAVLYDVERLDSLRSLMRDGWTYTEDDLREDVTERWDESAYDALQDVRSALRDGWTYTRADFTEGGGAEAVDGVDGVRAAAAAVRTFGWLLYLVAALLVAAFGLLAGRDWPGRLAWGAATVAACALVVALLFGVGFPAAASSLLEEARSQAVADVDPAGDYAATERLVIYKAFEAVESIFDALAGRVAIVSLAVAALAGAVAAAVVFRDRIQALAHDARRR